MTSRSPRIGFVSLGCPKALVDSERILTQLRAEGSEADAPEIDGVVRVTGRGASALPVGEFADVMVTGASEYDLEARLA